MTNITRCKRSIVIHLLCSNQNTLKLSVGSVIAHPKSNLKAAAHKRILKVLAMAVWTTSLATALTILALTTKLLTSSYSSELRTLNVKRNLKKLEFQLATFKALIVLSTVIQNLWTRMVLRSKSVIPLTLMAKRKKNVWVCGSEECSEKSVSQPRTRPFQLQSFLNLKPKNPANGSQHSHQFKRRLKALITQFSMRLRSGASLSSNLRSLNFSFVMM